MRLFEREPVYMGGLQITKIAKMVPVGKKLRIILHQNGERGYGCDRNTKAAAFSKTVTVIKRLPFGILTVDRKGLKESFVWHDVQTILEGCVIER